MNWYKKITYWENRKRVKSLSKFRDLVIDYFNNVEYDFLHIKENQDAIRIRQEINLRLNRVYSYIIYSGVNPEFYYSPPPAVGGIAGNIDLIHNIFNLHTFGAHAIQNLIQNLIDFIDRAIGIYEEDKINSLLRTFNPFFWLERLVDFIVGIPFKFIGKIGFNREKVEASIVGKTIKGVLYLITVGSAFLTILEKLDYLNGFKLWVHNLLK